MASIRGVLAALPRTAWVVSFGMFINKFGNFVNVFVVLYLTSRGYSPTEAGLALAAIGVGNFIGNALGGVLADRFGRRVVLVASMFSAGLVTMVVPLFSRSIISVLLVLDLLGLCAQLYRPAASAMVVDATDPPHLLTAFAVLRLAINVGMAVGPAVGGLLSTYSYTWALRLHSSHRGGGPGGRGPGGGRCLATAGYQGGRVLGV